MLGNLSHSLLFARFPVGFNIRRALCWDLAPAWGFGHVCAVSKPIPFAVGTRLLVRCDILPDRLQLDHHHNHHYTSWWRQCGEGGVLQFILVECFWAATWRKCGRSDLLECAGAIPNTRLASPSVWWQVRCHVGGVPFKQPDLLHLRVPLAFGCSTWWPFAISP